MYSKPSRNYGATGSLWVREGKRGPVIYARVQLPDGTNSNIRLGKLWTARGRAPDDGYLTRRGAEQRLQEILVDARRAVGMKVEKPTGETVGEVAEAWMLHGETTKGWKTSTLGDRRSVLRRHLIPAFGEWPIAEVTPQAIERWQAKALADGVSRRAVQKTVTTFSALCAYAMRNAGLAVNPVDRVEKVKERYDGTAFVFYQPDEVEALARAAADEQDAAIFLTAAYTGLRRGELLALRVRDIDFANSLIRVERSITAGVLGVPKSGHGRAVPMADQVGRVLARLLDRDRFTGADDPLFPSAVGGYLDPSALRRRFRAAQKRAGLKPIRFHDLRHTFASLAINSGSIVEVQAWCGHSDPRTTSRYLHHKARGDEAKRLTAAFAPGTIIEAEPGWKEGDNPLLGRITIDGPLVEEQRPLTIKNGQ